MAHVKPIVLSDGTVVVLSQMRFSRTMCRNSWRSPWWPCAYLAFHRGDPADRLGSVARPFLVACDGPLGPVAWRR